MEQVVDNGLYCVKLDGSGRRLKVRHKNLCLLDPRDPRARPPVPAEAAASSAGPAAAPDQAPHTARQHRRARPEPPLPAFPQGFLDAAAPLGGGTRPRDPLASSRMHGQSAHETAGTGVPAAGEAAGHSAPNAGSSGEGHEPGLLLRAFNNTNVRRDYGELFERGCEVLVADGIRRRGGALCGDAVHMRQAVLRLTVQLEAEMLAAREATEAEALAALALPPAASAGASPPQAPTAATGIHVLAQVDQVRALDGARA